MRNYILAHDLGTSGNKAVLYNSDNGKIDSYTVQYPLHYPKEGMAEQNPNDWWRAVCTSTRELINKAGINSSDIAAVSFSAIMNSLLPVDVEGVPLRDAMIWADNRSGKEAEKILSRISRKELYSITGHRVDSRYFVSKMLWFKNNETDLFKKTRYFLQAKDYITFKLTGNFRTDFSDASHLGCFNMHDKDWADDVLSEIGFNREKLPEIIKSTDVVGTVTGEAAGLTGLKEGTPVVIGGGDGCCATAGAGVYKKGQAYTILGTSAWTAAIMDEIVLPENMVTFYFVYLDGEHYVPCGTMQSAGHSLKWAVDRFYSHEAKEMGDDVYKKIEADISNKHPGSDNLLYLPYLLGERSPWWNDKAKGCFIGLTSRHDRADMINAVLEGVAFNLRIIVDEIEKQIGPAEMKIIGGGARNMQWLNIIANIFGKNIIIPEYVMEATSIGAIMCGGIGCGIFKDFSESKKINPDKNVVKHLPEATLLYDSVFQRFQGVYKALEPFFE